MVMSALPVKHDRRQPSMGAYDAIVYIEGSEVVAEDSKGRKIASGVAGTDDVTVIQAAHDIVKAAGGTIILSPGNYSFASTLTHDGNNVVIRGGAPQEYYEDTATVINQTGTGVMWNWTGRGGAIENIYLKPAEGAGNHGISTTSLLSSLQKIMNNVTITGKTGHLMGTGLIFDSQIMSLLSNVYIKHATTGMQILSNITDVNCNTFDRMEILGCTTGIDAATQVNEVNDNIFISLNISNCTTGIASCARFKRNVFIGPYAENVTNFTSGDFSSCQLILNPLGWQAPELAPLAIGNIGMQFVDGRILSSVEKNRPSALGNILSPNTISIMPGCYARQETISGRIINDTDAIFKCSAKLMLNTDSPTWALYEPVPGRYVMFARAKSVSGGVGNFNLRIRDSLAAVVVNSTVTVGTTYGFVYSDVFEITNAHASTYLTCYPRKSTTNADYIYVDYAGIVSVGLSGRTNSGSSTGTGSEQTIAHSLSTIPTGCKAWIKYLVGSRYVTEMIPFDATNVYPTVTSGLAYEWRIE